VCFFPKGCFEYQYTPIYLKMKNTQKTHAYEKPVLIIKSHVKAWFKEKGFWMTPDSARAINDAVIELLEKAIIRTKLNKRKTVTRRDI